LYFHLSKMIKAHKIRLNPTPEQELYFRKASDVARFVFNWGLEHWNTAYQNGEQPSAYALKAEFNSVKRAAFLFVVEVTKCAVEGAFMNLAKAFENFFRAKKEGKKIGYPKFKSKKRSKPSFYLANDKISFRDHEVYIPKLGWVNMTENLRLEGKTLSAVVSQTAGYWFVSVQIELAVPQPKPKTGTIGIDVGLKTLATTSDGEVFENQRHLAVGLRRIKGLSCNLSRKVKGSQNFLKAKLKLARRHYRVANQRNDVIHKLTTKLVNTYQVIAIEDLNVKGMAQNAALARSVADAAFGEIARQLEYKSCWVGSVLQKVDRFFPSSKRCSVCGEINRSLTLVERQWRCAGCSTCHERDVNAAVNIKLEAERLLAGSGYVGVTPVDVVALA
jgi:putative transposase